MADITATGPIADHHGEERRRAMESAPRRAAIGAAVASIARAVGQAFALAYVAPYQGRGPNPPATCGGEDVRDPSW
ncbi:MAG: hypothetical protein KF723_01210 [Rhizobiaceae bacterium]|nr:hypothetical protein [Rhizobiaceae bacterium]